MLRIAAERTAWITGTEYFRELVVGLARALDLPYAMLTEDRSGNRAPCILAFWPEERRTEEAVFCLADIAAASSPAGAVVAISSNLAEHLPTGGAALEGLGVRSYLAVPLTNTAGAVMGHVAVMDQRARSWTGAEIAVLEAISSRTADEIHSLRLQRALEAARSEYLAAVSHLDHELRTPLNGILGYTQLLARDPRLDVRQMEMINKMRKCGERMLETIEAAAVNDAVPENHLPDGPNQQPEAGEDGLPLAWLTRMLDESWRGDIVAVGRSLDELERQGRHPGLLAELRAHQRSFDMRAIRERLGRTGRGQA